MQHTDDDRQLHDNEQMFFAEEEQQSTTVIDGNSRKFWKVLVVDDEEDVHRVTRMVFDDFSFGGRRIKLYSCYSNSEAQQWLKENPDVAIVLLDVVMEEQDSGLQLVHYIRRELANRLVRIILRTGQPGQAPEEQVVLEYDINDYKSKTELTSQRLFTTVVAALRGYRDLVTIDRSRKGLEKIITASAGIFESRSLEEFVSGVLMQFVSLLGMENESLYMHTSGFTATNDELGLHVLAATGKYEHLSTDEELDGSIPDEIFEKISEALNKKQAVIQDNYYIGFFRSKNGTENIIFLERPAPLEEWEKNMVDIFCSNVTIAFDNIYLNQELEETQKEIIFILGELIERRSAETRNHVRRVSEYCRMLGDKYGLEKDDQEVLRVASAMHDIGKLCVPDSVLQKPGKLSSAEFELIKTHASAGGELFQVSRRNILYYAAIIAGQHHERWDGSGYPNRLQGEDIHLFARITSVADVFDALSSDRVYRKALPLQEVVDYFKSQRGKQFDPQLTDLLLANLDELEQIRKLMPGQLEDF